jgi:hypothetical protein
MNKFLFFGIIIVFTIFLILCLCCGSYIAYSTYLNDNPNTSINNTPRNNDVNISTPRDNDTKDDNSNNNRNTSEEVIKLKQYGSLSFKTASGYEVFRDAPDSILVGNRSNRNVFIITSGNLSTGTIPSQKTCNSFDASSYSEIFTSSNTRFISSTYNTKGDLSYCLIKGYPGIVESSELLRPAELYIIKKNDGNTIYYISSYKYSSDSVIDNLFSYFTFID